MPRTPSYRYQPDESQKEKHRPVGDEACFTEDPGGALVGHCAGHIDVEYAQDLLDDCVPYFGAKRNKLHPRQVYAVDDDGTLYRATWTTHGRTMHGFPEHPRSFPAGTEGAKVRAKLIEVASAKGCLDELREWMNW